MSKTVWQELHQDYFKFVPLQTMEDVDAGFINLLESSYMRDQFLQKRYPVIKDYTEKVFKSTQNMAVSILRILDITWASYETTDSLCSDWGKFEGSQTVWRAICRLDELGLIERQGNRFKLKEGALKCK